MSAQANGLGTRKKARRFALQGQNKFDAKHRPGVSPRQGFHFRGVIRGPRAELPIAIRPGLTCSTPSASRKSSLPANVTLTPIAHGFRCVSAENLSTLRCNSAKRFSNSAIRRSSRSTALDGALDELLGWAGPRRQNARDAPARVHASQARAPVGLDRHGALASLSPFIERQPQGLAHLGLGENLCRIVRRIDFVAVDCVDHAVDGNARLVGRGAFCDLRHAHSAPAAAPARLLRLLPPAARECPMALAERRCLRAPIVPGGTARAVVRLAAVGRARLRSSASRRRAARRMPPSAPAGMCASCAAKSSIECIAWPSTPVIKSPASRPALSAGPPGMRLSMRTPSPGPRSSARTPR